MFVVLQSTHIHVVGIGSSQTRTESIVWNMWLVIVRLLLPHRHGQVVVSPSTPSTSIPPTPPTQSSWPPSHSYTKLPPLPPLFLSTIPRHAQPRDAILLIPYLPSVNHHSHNVLHTINTQYYEITLFGERITCIESLQNTAGHNAVDSSSSSSSCAHTLIRLVVASLPPSSSSSSPSPL